MSKNLFDLNVELSFKIALIQKFKIYVFGKYYNLFEFENAFD
jgi:hypothetical protein